MANVNSAATVWNCPNYTGELYLVGGGRTPFLNMIGGLESETVRYVSGFEFSLGQPFSLEAASQPSISESASLSAPAATTYVRGQETNTVQIYQSQISVSYAKQSVTGQVKADAVTGMVAMDVQPVANELDFQIQAHLRQIALDVEHTFFNGTYQKASDASTAARTRGMISACSTNVVDAENASLSKSLVDELMRTMADNGAEFNQPVIFANAAVKQKLSEIYGFAPQDRAVGGVNVSVLETDFAQVGIVWASQVPASTMLVADVDCCHPVYLPVPGKGVMFYEELSRVGASETGQLYAQIGLDYGPESYHGKIVNIA